MQQVQEQVQEQLVEQIQQDAEPQIAELSSADLARIGGGAGNAGLSF